jgi:hypothetical protein
MPKNKKTSKNNAIKWIIRGFYYFGGVFVLFLIISAPARAAAGDSQLLNGQQFPFYKDSWGHYHYYEFDTDQNYNYIELEYYFSEPQEASCSVKLKILSPEGYQWTSTAQHPCYTTPTKAVFDFNLNKSGGTTNADKFYMVNAETGGLSGFGDFDKFLFKGTNANQYQQGQFAPADSGGGTEIDFYDPYFQLNTENKFFTINIQQPTDFSTQDYNFTVSGTCSNGGATNYNDVYISAYGMLDLINATADIFLTDGCITGNFSTPFQLAGGLFYTLRAKLCAGEADCPAFDSVLMLNIASGGVFVPPPLAPADCEDTGTISGALCKVSQFLFSPSEVAVSQFTGLGDYVKTKAPIGYLTLMKDAFEQNLATTSLAFDIDTEFDLDFFADENNPINVMILNPFRVAIIFILWFMVGIYYYKRLAHLEI